MEIAKNKNLTSILNKISFIQLSVLCLITVCALFWENHGGLFFGNHGGHHHIKSGFVIAGIFSFIYTQSLQFSAQSKVFMLLGFPLRLLFIALPAALLVHKFHANLLALFIGFVLSQVIYFVFIWSYAKNIRTCH